MITDLWCYSRGRLVTERKHCLCILIVRILGCVAVVFVELCLSPVGGKSKIKNNAGTTITGSEHTLEHLQQTPSVWESLESSELIQGDLIVKRAICIALIQVSKPTKVISSHRNNASRSHKQRHLREGIISVYDVTSSKHLTTKPWHIAATNGL